MIDDNVTNGDDADMTREPEMVQAYRDTWELGLHSYLTYLRDRLVLARELLTQSGSIFVQISDENLHHVRELLDEVFGAENFCALIPFRKTSGAGNPNGLQAIGSVADYLLWYARDSSHLKYQQLYVPSDEGRAFDATFTWVHDSNGKRKMTKQERSGDVPLQGRRFARADLSAQNDNQMYPFTFRGVTYTPKNRGWRTTQEGMERLNAADRLIVSGKTLRFVQYADDFAFSPLQAMWADTGTGSFLEDKMYVVQTGTKVLERCLLMCTSPGDLVFDPTCGSGTTAIVAEQWGRRWITCDTSRVPLALARQRLLAATFPWYELKDDSKGPGGGFVYRRKQNGKGEEVGGIVPHVTLKSIATNEPPEEEMLVDRPEKDDSITRVTGPFCFEATIPTPMEWEEETKEEKADAENTGTFTDRMMEVLRRSPVLHLEGNRKVTLKSIRPPSKTLSLSAEALVDATAEGQTATLADAVREAEEKSGLALPLSSRPVAIVFGPENGAVNVRLVEEAAREAYQKSYTHLYVIGFAIQPNAREAVEVCEQVSGIPATYVQATPDLMMGDLLKNMRSSQIFSVCGLPEIAVKNAKHKDGDPPGMKQVELLGLDVFDPVTMEVSHASGDDVPAWFLDTDYNGMCFHVSQAFFPRTSEWDKLKKALKGEFEDSVWEHLAGTVSAPFLPGDQKQIGVKVIDIRGNELLVVKKLQG
jgi:adenine-specific DNA-methyltransferase